MITLKDDNGKELPKKVHKRVNDFIDGLKDVPWFKPSKDLKKEDVDKQAKFTLKCFGIEAGIEYRKLEKKEDWDSASTSAWDSTWGSALDYARDSAWDSVMNSARDSASAWISSWDSARTSARASAEVLFEDNKQFKEKYPNGAFKQLFKLREMGLYPVGVLEENKKFVVYVPQCEGEFPDLVSKDREDVN